MDQYTIDFFIDYEVLTTTTKEIIEEAKGHLILLDTNNQQDNTNNICIPVLLDGNTIEFLFGSKCKNKHLKQYINKSKNVKNFIHNLDDRAKNAIASFYQLVIRSMIKYHKQLNHPCSFLWNSLLIYQLKQDIDDAYHCLKQLITNENIIKES